MVASIVGVNGMLRRRVFAPGSSFCFGGEHLFSDSMSKDRVELGGVAWLVDGRSFTAAKKRNKSSVWFSIRKSML